MFSVGASCEDSANCGHVNLPSNPMVVLPDEKAREMISGGTSGGMGVGNGSGGMGDGEGSGGGTGSGGTGSVGGNSGHGSGGAGMCGCGSCDDLRIGIGIAPLSWQIFSIVRFPLLKYRLMRSSQRAVSFDQRV